MLPQWWFRCAAARSAKSGESRETMLTPAHIDLYVKMKADPVTHAGYRVDAALIFCEFVEIMLCKLDAREREIVLLRSYGYSQEEIAEMRSVSLKTISREYGDIDQKVFAEFSEMLSRFSGTIRHRRACSDGKRLGRPRRKREAVA